MEASFVILDGNPLKIPDLDAIKEISVLGDRQRGKDHLQTARLFDVWHIAIQFHLAFQKVITVRLSAYRLPL